MENFSRQLLAMYDEARHCTPDEFFGFLIRQLREPFQFDSAIMAAGQLDRSGLQYHSCQLWNRPIEKVIDHANIASDDSVSLDMLRSPGRVITAAFDEETRKHNYSQELQTYSRRWDIGQTMCLWGPYGSSKLATGMALWRPLDAPRYTQHEQQLGQLMLPHVMQALAFNLADSVSAVNLDHDSGALIVNPRGFVISMDGRAQALIQCEWPQWQPPALPPALLSMAGARHDGRFAGRQIDIQVVPHLSFHMLRIRRKRGAGLTDAELRVAACAAQGKTYKEIARILDISPATVRNHLHRIYDKLAVSNKTELVAKLRG